MAKGVHFKCQGKFINLSLSLGSQAHRCHVVSTALTSNALTLFSRQSNWPDLYLAARWPRLFKEHVRFFPGGSGQNVHLVLRSRRAKVDVGEMNQPKDFNFN